MRYTKTVVSVLSSRAMQIDDARGKTARACGCLLAAFLLSLSPARADVTADWNKIALHAVVSSGQRPAQAAREMAMVHVAMFETMNFIEGVYVPHFVVKPPRRLGASGEAAAAAAAHHVLVQLHPEQKAALDAALHYSVAAIPDEPEQSRELVTGRSLGANIYAIWRPTSADAGSSEVSGTPKMTRVRGSARAEASATAWYWIVARFVEARRLAPIEGARIYALVSMAVTDLYAHDLESRCAPCAAGAAIRVILESELGPAAVPGMMLASAGAPGAADSWSRIRDYAMELSSERPDGGVNRRASIEAGEELGRKIGLQALTHYKAATR
jgi:hypothetical protein